MSVRSLAELAVQRDASAPFSSRPVTGRIRRSNSHVMLGFDGTAGDSGDATVEIPIVMEPGEALVKAIPTEPLALYTGLVSGIVALLPDDASSLHSYVPLRWWLYGGSAFFVALWVIGSYRALLRRDLTTAKKRKFPLVEVLAAWLAFGTWGLVMPDSPLRVVMDGDSETITTLCVSFGGAAVLYLFAQWGLTKPSNSSTTTT